MANYGAESASLVPIAWFDPDLVDFAATGTLYTITLEAASPNEAVIVKQARPVRTGTGRTQRC
jgi:hypothetical protein